MKRNKLDIRHKLHVKTGDRVKIITGDFKGMDGTITKVNTKTAKVAIDCVPKFKKTVRRSQQHPEGGFVDVDRWIHHSNVRKLDAQAAEAPAAKKTAKKAASKKKAVENKD